MRMTRKRRMQDKDAGQECGKRRTKKRGGMSKRETRMRMKTTMIRRTRMRTRGEDNKEDKDEGQQGGQGTTTRTLDKDVDNEGQRDEYKDCKL